MTTVEVEGPHDQQPAHPPAFRVPAYRRFALGQAVSVLGDQVWYVALSWAAVQIASPQVAGVILAVSSIPRLLFMLFGGVIVDRYSPRKLMIHSDVIRACVAFAAALVAVWQPGVALLVGVALIFGLADAIFLPAASALQPRLLEPSQYASGSATTAMANRLALTLGAPLGGLLVAFGGLPLACVVNAVTFVVSVAALRSVRPRSATSGTRARGGLWDGLTYIFRHRVLRMLLVVSLLCNVGFVGPMNVGLAFASEARGWGAAGIGAMLSGFGAGTILGGLVMMRFKPQSGLGWIVGFCLAVQGAGVVVPSLTSDLGLAVGATLVVGLMSGPAAILMSALGQTQTDDAYRGRVGSVNALVSLGITPLAVAAMGVAVAKFGLVPTVAVSGCLELAAAACCLIAPALRTARLAY